jgi:tetratricopeptide repeat protein 30
MNDLSDSEKILNNASEDRQETLVCKGCVLYKENKFEDAQQMFTNAKKLGESPDIEYNIGVCCYKLKMLSSAHTCIQNILEDANKNHPDIILKSRVDPGMPRQSLANSPALYESCLIEAYNLKAAIDYHLGNNDDAKECLNEMPPREDEELDSVTLHNLALVNIEKDPDDSFKKLNFLLKNPPCPPEALANLLILYCKYEQYDLAHDVLSENEDLKSKYLSDEEISYITALSMMRTSKEAAYESLEKLGKIYRDAIEKQHKLMKDNKNNTDKNFFSKIVNNYENILQKYLPVITAQAKIFWDLGNYDTVESILKSNDIQEIYNENQTWKINLGHAYFIQETYFKEAINYYMDVYNNATDIMVIPASVIANLCVSLIMIQRNEEAQEIIKTVEEEEAKAMQTNPEGQYFHVCIVNLIVGTLYCAKGNYEFGIGRILVSFQNFHKRMNMDTWYYAKRCFLSLIENLAKQILCVPDKLFLELLNFLDNADKYGKNITTQITDSHSSEENAEKCTVSSEARLLKKMLLKIKDHYYSDVDKE